MKSKPKLRNKKASFTTNYVKFAQKDKKSIAYM